MGTPTILFLSLFSALMYIPPSSGLTSSTFILASSPTRAPVVVAVMKMADSSIARWLKRGFFQIRLSRIWSDWKP
ncbi:MAG TPA: hypothetical protein VJ944_00695 [Thermoplasmataceae archaeon]|nr:hypothetical protein [Thermoplasmataceae archaeon]